VTNLIKIKKVLDCHHSKDNRTISPYKINTSVDSTLLPFTYFEDIDYQPKKDNGGGKPNEMFLLSGSLLSSSNTNKVTWQISESFLQPSSLILPKRKIYSQLGMQHSTHRKTNKTS